MVKFEGNCGAFVISIDYLFEFPHCKFFEKQNKY
jgi:hypothetical protein